jgi:hypothetical protein
MSPKLQQRKRYFKERLIGAQRQAEYGALVGVAPANVDDA